MFDSDGQDVVRYYEPNKSEQVTVHTLGLVQLKEPNEDSDHIRYSLWYS